MLVLVQRLLFILTYYMAQNPDEDPSKTPGCVSTTLIQTYSLRPISSSVFASNVEVRLRTGRWQQSTLDIRVRRLRLFGHLARTEPSTDTLDISSRMAD